MLTKWLVPKQPPSDPAPLVVGGPGPGQSRDGKENGGGGPNRSNPQKGKGVLERMWAAQRQLDEDDEDDEALLDEVAKDAAVLAEMMPRLRAVVGELPSQEALEALLRLAKFDLEGAATLYFDNVSATDVSTEASADAPLGVAGSSSSSSTALVVQPPGTPRPDPTPLGVVVAPPSKSRAVPLAGAKLLKALQIVQKVGIPLKLAILLVPQPSAGERPNHKAANPWAKQSVLAVSAEALGACLNFGAVLDVLANGTHVHTIGPEQLRIETLNAQPVIHYVDMPERLDAMWDAAQLAARLGPMCEAGGSLHAHLEFVHGSSKKTMINALLAVLTDTSRRQVTAKSAERLEYLADYEQHQKLKQEAVIAEMRKKLALKHPQMDPQELDKKAKKETPPTSSRFNKEPQEKRRAVQANGGPAPPLKPAPASAIATALVTHTLVSTPPRSRGAGRGGGSRRQGGR